MDASAFPHSNFDRVLCATCGGRCCQAHPGMWNDPLRFFQAFGLTPIKTASELGRRLPHELTVRELLGVPVPVPRRSEDGCIFHSPRGCLLTPKQRPCQCLALIPDVTTQMEGEIRCHLQPGQGSDVTHRNWQNWWQSHSPL